VYQPASRADLEAALSDPRVRAHGLRSVGPNVLFLGLTSLVTDISSEMITSVMPIYVVFQLQQSMVVFGVIDGLQQGGASLVRLISGWLTDRSRRYKEIAGFGYFVSALCRLGLLIVGRSAEGIVGVTLADRLGKGVRTSPRDALISLSAPGETLAAAFGVHRALDTAGAMLGPLVTFGLLALLPGAFDVLFVTSLAIALVGVAILVAFVRNPSSPAPVPESEGRADAGSLFADGRFRAITVAAGAMGLVNISDSFLYLAMQHRFGFPPQYLPLLFVATPAVYMILAIPLGRLADRVGRAPIIVAGYAALLAAYGALFLPVGGPLAIAACVPLLGTYYAATDGVMLALASAVLPAARRGTGLSIVTTANNVGRILASVAFGWLWSRLSAGATVGVFAGAMGVTLIVAGTMLLKLRREVAHA
jgi:MFS family permease